MIGFAHRGGRAGAPENTLEAFSRALALGASGLETDVRLSADGAVVAVHDPEVRAGGQRLVVAETRLADLPARVCSLAELYRHCGTAFELSVDVKDPAALGPVVAAAGEVGALPRLWLCHHSLARLRLWGPLVGDARLVWSTTPERLVDVAVEELRGSPIHAVNLRLAKWTPPLAERVREAGLAAFGWDAQRVRALRRALRLGLDAVYCDDVVRMVAVLAEAPPAPSGHR